MFERFGGNLGVRRLHRYLLSADDGFGDEVQQLLDCSHPDGEAWYDYEGSIRAAVWAVLRLRLPRTWFVEAEAAYPRSLTRRRYRGDVIVWPSGGRAPIVFEVKRELHRSVIGDRDKLLKEIRAASSRLKRGYVVFPVRLPDDLEEEELFDYLVSLGTVFERAAGPVYAIPIIH